MLHPVASETVNYACVAAVGGMLLKDMTKSALRTSFLSAVACRVCELVFLQKLKLSAEPQLKITQEDRLLFGLIGRFYRLMKKKQKQQQVHLRYRSHVPSREMCLSQMKWKCLEMM